MRLCSSCIEFAGKFASRAAAAMLRPRCHHRTVDNKPSDHEDIPPVFFFVSSELCSKHQSCEKANTNQKKR